MASRSSRSALPSAPVDLMAAAIGGCQVILAWTEFGDGADGLGFRIERADCHGPRRKFVEIGQVGPHVAAFLDRSVDPLMTYQYRVHAWNASGDSSPTNVVEVTTPRPGEEPPTDQE